MSDVREALELPSGVPLLFVCIDRDFVEAYAEDYNLRADSDVVADHLCRLLCTILDERYSVAVQDMEAEPEPPERILC